MIFQTAARLVAAACRRQTMLHSRNVCFRRRLVRQRSPDLEVCACRCHLVQHVLPGSGRRSPRRQRSLQRVSRLTKMERGAYAMNAEDNLYTLCFADPSRSGQTTIEILSKSSISLYCGKNLTSVYPQKPLSSIYPSNRLSSKVQVVLIYGFGYPGRPQKSLNNEYLDP